jgi:hypothetical protein
MTQNRVTNPRVARYEAAARRERQASAAVTLLALALTGACVVMICAVLSS